MYATSLIHPSVPSLLSSRSSMSIYTYIHRTPTPHTPIHPLHRYIRHRHPSPSFSLSFSADRLVVPLPSSLLLSPSLPLSLSHISASAHTSLTCITKLLHTYCLSLCRSLGIIHSVLFVLALYKCMFSLSQSLVRVHRSSWVPARGSAGVCCSEYPGLGTRHPD